MNSIKVLYTLALIFFLTAFTLTSEKEEANKYYDEGMQKMEAQDIIAAVGAFTNAISHDSTFGKAYIQLAIAKNKMSKMFGYEDMSLCFDLNKALTLGELEAEPLLEQYCMGHCYHSYNAAYRDSPEQLLCVDLSNQELEEIPNAHALKNVVKVLFHDNHATHVPHSISGIKHLINLDLSNNNIKTISHEIGGLEYLRTLNLNKNNLESIPNNFKNLKNLKSLFLRQNNLKHIPGYVAQLENLEVLDLSMNQLTSLPLHFVQLKNLETLILVGNDISPKNQLIIKKMLPNTVIQF